MSGDKTQPLDANMEQAWSEIRDTMADNMLNQAQKKVFVISILKGQLANPPTLAPQGLPPAGLREAADPTVLLDEFRSAIEAHYEYHNAGTFQTLKYAEEKMLRTLAAPDPCPLCARPEMQYMGTGLCVKHVNERNRRAAHADALPSGFREAVEAISETWQAFRSAKTPAAYRARGMDHARAMRNLLEGLDMDAGAAERERGGEGGAHMS